MSVHDGGGINVLYHLLRVTPFLEELGEKHACAKCSGWHWETSDGVSRSEGNVLLDDRN